MAISNSASKHGKTHTRKKRPVPTQTPRITYSPLTHQWYVLTRYTLSKGVNPTTLKPVTYYRAFTKYDVTDQMTAILEGVLRAP